MSSVAAKVVTGGLWLAGARALVNLLSFVSTIYLARLLTPADFGLVAIATTIMLILNAVTDMSLSQALVQHQSPTDEHLHTAWTLNVARATLLAVLLATAAEPIAWIYREPKLSPVVYALAFSLFLSGFDNPRRVMLAKRLIFWQDFVLTVGQRLVYVIVAIGIAVIYQSYWAMIAGIVVAQGFAIAISYTIMPFKPRVGVRYARELWSFSIWLTLSRAIGTVNARFDQLLVGNLLGRQNLGLYSVGDNLAQMPTREAILPLTSTLFPALSQIRHDPARMRSAYLRAQELVAAIALPAGVGFALIADPFIAATMGQKWLGAIPIVQCLSVISALQAVASLVWSVGMAKGESRLLFRRDMQMFLIRLPIVTLAMLLFGITGLLAARVMTGLLSILVNMLLVRKLLELSVVSQLCANLRPLVSTFFMAIGVLIAGQMGLLALLPGDLADVVEVGVTAALGCVLYVASTSLMWVWAERPAGPERQILTVAKRILRPGSGGQGE